MARILPPPAERFDPITARWFTPGGPLHDPQRDSFDPGHDDPVKLLGPVPRELAGPDEPRTRDGETRNGAGSVRRRRWATLAILAIFIVALLIGGFLIY